MEFVVLHWEGQGSKILLGKAHLQETLIPHHRMSQPDTHQRVCLGLFHCNKNPADMEYNPMKRQPLCLDCMLRIHRDTAPHTLFLKGNNDQLDKESHEDL